MIKLLIIEDEALAIKRILRLLDNIDQTIEIIDTLSTVKESIQFLENHIEKIDLIFMDIHLGDGKSFEIFDQLLITKPIIFITAYDQYALQAFKQLSVDYLLKPIQQVDLEKAIEKFNLSFRQDNTNTKDYQKILDVIQASKEPLKKRFLVNVGDKIRYINVEDIALFYAENKACFVISKSGKRYYVNYTLEKLMNMLDEAVFHRVNRKVIINIEAIVEIVPYSKSKLLLKANQNPGFEIFVSAERVKAFKEWLNA